MKYSKSYSEANVGHVNEGASEVKRPLLTPDEAARLPNDSVFIRIEGRQPLLVKKINYLENTEFQRRASFKRVASSDRLVPEENFPAPRVHVESQDAPEPSCTAEEEINNTAEASGDFSTNPDDLCNLGKE